MPAEDKKSPWRAFLDFFILFSGISTASNLSRTQSQPVRQRGLFLFRRPAREAGSSSPESK
jgi:hypothetical protein